MGGLPVSGLPAVEKSLAADQGGHRLELYRSAGAAVMVNPGADGCSWAGDVAEES